MRSRDFGNACAPVRTKRQSARLFARGVFGNNIRTWESIDAVRREGYDGLLVLRTARGALGGGRAVYDLTVNAAAKVPFDPSVNYFNEQVNHPDNPVVINGECMRTHRGLELTYNTVDLPMRPALKHPDVCSVHGLVALEVMRTLVCPQGLSAIEEVLEMFDGHVIEFSTFTRRFGSLNWRTVIWEVRAH